jgi:hypothetical protein
MSFFRNLFHKVKPHPNSLYSYHAGPVYTNGALQLVFDKKWQYPIVVMQGAGQYAGQWRTMQNPQLRAHVALTPATLEGAGIRAGQINQQPLLDLSAPDTNAAIGEI